MRSRESKENKEGSGQGCRGGGKGERRAKGWKDSGKEDRAEKNSRGDPEREDKRENDPSGHPRAVTSHHIATWGSPAVTGRYNSTQFNLIQTAFHDTYGISLASCQGKSHWLVEGPYFLGPISGFLR